VTQALIQYVWVHQTILIFAKNVNKPVYKKFGTFNKSRDASRLIKNILKKAGVASAQSYKPQ